MSEKFHNKNNKIYISDNLLTSGRTDGGKTMGALKVNDVMRCPINMGLKSPQESEKAYNKCEL